MDENNFPNIFNEPESKYPGEQGKRIFGRSKHNVLIAGVCAGIAKYTKTDPAVIRVLAMLTLLFGGWSVAAYLIMAALTPTDKYEDNPTEEDYHKQRKINYKTVLSGLMILSGIYFGFRSIGYFASERLFVLPNSYIVPIVSFIIGVLLLYNKYYTKIPDVNYKINFYRSRKDRRLLGVCGGIAEYTDTDSTTIRTIFFISTLLTLGTFAAAYLILAFFSQLETNINDVNS
ncbi:MAG: PspC domain-containing protein [Bacteroidota bacterium]